MIKFEVVKKDCRTTNGDVILPKRQTKHSAGYDFYAPFTFVVPPKMKTPLYFTDIKADMKTDLFNLVLMIFPRSSLGNKGLRLANTTGIIDADYYGNPKNDGNIGFVFENTSDETIIVKKGERFMQGVFLPYFITDEDNVTTERVGGHGSTN